MILVVDLLRYWLHRAAHENDTLWRLHSVHHSVEQMYWLNTARFHLIEKAMQMTLDSLPFLLMAVDPTVLALYYVAYATNGFFQHCNIDAALRRPQLHRRQRGNASVASLEDSARVERQLRQHRHRLGPAVRHVVPAARAQRCKQLGLQDPATRSPSGR